MANFSVSYVYRIIDRYSGPLQKVNEATRRYTKKIQDATRNTKNFEKRMDKLKDRASELRGQLLDVAAIGYMFAKPVRSALEFEEKMADIKKVVDFSTSDGLAKMSKNIRSMSKEIPVSASGLAEIVAAGGQLGIAEENLANFAKIAAKMSVAFDMMPNEAGDAMAKLSNIFKIPIDETALLGDAINNLSNNTAASAEEIVRALKNKGAAAGIAMKLTANQSTALAGTLISLGVNADRVGSIMDKMARTFTDSKLVGKDLAKAFREDAGGTLIKFLEGVNKLSDDKKAVYLNKMFAEFQTRVGLLSENLPQLQRSLDLTSDSTKFAGSMTAEYNSRIATGSAKIQLFQNKMQNTAIVIGSSVIPALTTALDIFGRVFSVIAILAEKFPRLTSAITTLIGVLIAVRIATLAYAFSMTQLNIAFLATSKAVATAIPWIIKFSAALFANPLGLIVVGVVAAVAAITLLYKKFEWFRKLVEKVKNGLISAFDWAKSAVGLGDKEISVEQSRQLVVDDRRNKQVGLNGKIDITANNAKVNEASFNQTVPGNIGTNLAGAN